MTDRWTNGVITIVLPLDGVGPDDTPEEKQGAAALLLSDCSDTLGPQWGDAVMSATYEDVEPSGDGTRPYSPFVVPEGTCRQCQGDGIDPSSGHDGTKPCRWCDGTGKAASTATEGADDGR